MRGSRADRPGEVPLPGWEADLPYPPTVNINIRVRIQVLHIQNDAPAGPILGDGNCAFVPGALDLLQIRVLPARVAVERLVVALHIVLIAGPAGGPIGRAHV